MESWGEQSKFKFSVMGDMKYASNCLSSKSIIAWHDASWEPGGYNCNHNGGDETTYKRMQRHGLKHSGGGKKFLDTSHGCDACF